VVASMTLALRVEWFVSVRAIRNLSPT